MKLHWNVPHCRQSPQSTMFKQQNLMSSYFICFSRDGLKSWTSKNVNFTYIENTEAALWHLLFIKGLLYKWKDIWYGKLLLATSQCSLTAKLMIMIMKMRWMMMGSISHRAHVFRTKSIIVIWISCKFCPRKHYQQDWTNADLTLACQAKITIKISIYSTDYEWK
jgi:hypothetical protein